MKKRIKAAVIIFMSAIIIYSSVIAVHYAIMYARIGATIQYKLHNTTAISGFETTYHNFYEKYNSMKESLSENPDFVDLIPALDIGAFFDSIKDDADNSITDADVYIFYQDMIDQKFIEITEGRCIDINHNGKDGIEIMVPSDFNVAVGDKITLTFGLYDENGNKIKLNAEVVGKYKKYKPFYFPKESFDSYFSYNTGYMQTGKYNSNIVIQNIADYVDITAYVYKGDVNYYNNDGNFAIKDPLDRNIRLLPVYKNGVKRDLNVMYEVAENNSAIVFQDTHREWLRCLFNMNDYFIIAVVSGVVTLFGIFTLIIFIKYNFRRKNDNTVKEQHEGISQG